MKREIISGVYCWLHRPSGRCYVGSSKDILRRKIEHGRDSLKKWPLGFCRHLAKLGIDSFDFEILESCEPEVRLVREKFWIIFLESVYKGFNVKKNPTDGWNYVMSEESSRKLSAARRNRVTTEETRAKLRVAHGGKNHHFFGKKQSEETRKKISIAHIGKKMSPETRMKISLIGKGRVFTTEHKAKIGESNRRRKYSQATIEKMRRSALARYDKNRNQLILLPTP